nr:hypothetical protein CFP56_55322 [Quercus suber]
MSAKRKGRRKSHERKEALDDTGAAYEEVQKDLSALSKEEQMDVLYREQTFDSQIIQKGHLWSRICQHLERKILSKRLLLNSFVISIHISLLLEQK